jgi:protein-S-isoprenylcysteine O-methyltransferase Ste14
LAMIGTAIARREPRGFVAFALLWLAFVIKSRMEEGFMRKTFGAEYEEYSRVTGALVPRVWSLWRCRPCGTRVAKHSNEGNSVTPREC